MDNPSCIMFRHPWTLAVLCVVLLLCPTRLECLEAFDTHDIPHEAELTSVKVSNVLYDETTNTEDTLTRTRSFNSLVLDPPSMPVQLEIELTCKGHLVHFKLNFHNDNNKHDNTEPSNYNNFTEAGEIPVFTQTSKSNQIQLDNFPRLHTRNCRTFRDVNNQAAFLVIYDPVFSSYKFFGTFLMGKSHFFVQPYALAGSTRDDRLHVTTENIGFVLYDNGRGAEAQLMPYSPQTKRLPTNNHDQFQTHEQAQSNHKVQHFNELLTTLRSYAEQVPRSPSSNVEAEFTETTSLETNTDRAQSTNPPPVTETLNSVMEPHDHQTRPIFIPQETEADESGQENSNTNKDPATHQSLTDFLLSQLHIPFLHNHGQHTRKKRQSLTTYTVEVVILCDHLCYRKFQTIYGISDEVQTKNVIALFFSFLRELLQLTFASVSDLHPQFDTAIEITVPGIFIASDPRTKIIANYSLGDDYEVDSEASLYEFALWVQDNLASTMKADHYALVTGYDLYSQRGNQGTVGQVTRISNVCDIDSVSITEFLPTILPTLVSHELGHSLGSIHDSDTGGICNDDDQFIMASVLQSATTIDNQGNGFRFSICSAFFMTQTLPNKECVKRIDFNGSSELPDNFPLVGQQFSMDEQCSLRLSGSSLCREKVALLKGSWDRVCSSRPCKFPGNDDICFGDYSLQFTSCGNRRWCENGMCVDSPDAPETPVDCPAGDDPDAICDVRMCSHYDEVTRFVQCCRTCSPTKTERFVVIEAK